MIGTTGEKIRQYRILAGLSQDELVDSIDISKSSLQRLEKDDFKRPPTHIFRKIEKVLNLVEGFLDNDDKLSHYPRYLREFILNPENISIIELAYIQNKEHIVAETK